MGLRWDTISKPAKTGMWKQAGIAGENGVNGPVTRSMQTLTLNVVRTTLRMGMCSPATCVLLPAATAALGGTSCARRTPHGTKAECGVQRIDGNSNTFPSHPFCCFVDLYCLNKPVIKQGKDEYISLSKKKK